MKSTRAALAAVTITLGVTLAACSLPIDGRDIGADSPETTAPAAAPESTEPPELTTESLDLKVKVLSKQCFGFGAGCNVEYRVEPEAIDPEVPDDASFEVTYEVRGPETGTETGTLVVSGGEYEVESVMTSTRSKGVKLKVKVTEVVAQ